MENEPENLISYPDGYFDFSFKNEWIVNPIVKDMI